MTALELELNGDVVSVGLRIGSGFFFAPGFQIQMQNKSRTTDGIKTNTNTNINPSQQLTSLVFDGRCLVRS